MKNKKIIFVMTAILIATFITSVETTIVTTALPTIIDNLKGLSYQSWVFSVYLLATAITTPIYGKLSDQLGRKPIFIFGLVFIILGSILCGIASTMFFLIAARTIQGIGAGAVIPTTFAIIADSFPFEKRAQVMGLNNTSWGVSALTGPLIGGFIVDKLNWHWIFFINVPLGLLVLVIMIFGYQEKKSERTTAKTKIDVSGTIYLSIFLVTLLLFFQNLGTQPIRPMFESGILMLTLLFLVAFIWQEGRSSDPIIPLKSFSNLTFSLQILTALFLSGAQIGFQIYFPIWIQSIYGKNAAIAGLAVTPSPITWLLISFFVGIFLKRFAPKYLIIISVLIQTISYCFIVTSGMDFPLAAFYIVSGLTGLGLGVSITTNTVVAQRLMEENVGVASSMITLGRSLGQAIMTGIYGFAFSFSFNLQLAHRVRKINYANINQFINASTQSQFSPTQQNQIREIILNALHTVFWIVLAVFLIVLVINLFDRQKESIK